MPRPPDAADLWAIGPHQFKTLPNNTCLVIRADSGAVSIMDARWRPFLALFQPFRTLAEHSATLIAGHAGLAPHQPAIRALLERLCQDGIFVSGRVLVERLMQAPPAAVRRPRAPPRIAVTTCDRPQQLDRLLQSLLENERTYGNRWRYEIVDDSRRADAIAQNQALIAAHAADLDLHYHGQAERQAFLDHLLHQLPDDAAPPLRWLLDSADPAHQGQSTYGCPKNYLLLRYAGERLLLIDDDALMHGWRPQADAPALRFGAAGRSRRLATDLAELKAGLVAAPADPIAEQAGLLGAGLAEALERTGAGLASEALLAQASLAQLAQLDGTDCSIRATMSGVIGDPGTQSDITLLSQEQDVQALLAADRELLAGARCVYTGEADWRLIAHDYFHLATLAGLDLAGWLPPLMPSGRGEDTMIAVLLELLYPRDLTLVSPTALEHVPVPPRPWRPSADHLVEQLTPAAAFCSWARALALGASYAAPRIKLAELQGHFQALAATASGRGHLREQLTAATKQQWAHLYGEIARAYVRHRTSQGHWAAVAGASLAKLQALLAAPEVVTAQRLAALIDDNQRYFIALDAWEAARLLVGAAARDHGG